MAKITLNSKLTKGFCLQNSSHPLKKQRSDAKFCSRKCSKQYELQRKEKGFIKHAFRGNRQELEQHYKKIKMDINNDLLFMFHFKPDLEHIDRAIKEKGTATSWYVDFEKFRMEYIAHNPKNPIELYFSESKMNLIQLTNLKPKINSGNL